jgi:DNA processing protein
MDRCPNCALPLLNAMNLPQDELHAWLALAAGGLSARRRSRQLLACFGGALEVFRAGPTAAQEALEGHSVDELFGATAAWADTADRTRRWLAASGHHHVLHLGHANYPAVLLNGPDPPLVLHAIGNLEGFDRSAVAIVGSRHATPAGIQVAQRLAAELGVLGIEVVSGLAVGIDAAAHESALGTGGSSSTIAVVGCGLDEVYPRQHRSLFNRIAEAGLIVSEHPLGTPALPAYFPQRNRIIAGLSCAVVVVEATVRSGSLITARLAAEAGRDVFAIPGHPASAQSAGCNYLIKNGAGLLEHVSDIVESQPWAFDESVRAAVHAPKRQRPRRTHGAAPTVGNTASFGGGPKELTGASWSRASRMLRARPCSLTELAETTSDSPMVMSRILLLAELEGLVARLPGGLYQWCARA